MSVETALFFESLEEIYTRVFQTIRPRTALPGVIVKFRRYAGINCRIRLSGGMLSVDLSDLLENAPSPIQEALAVILISKLYRKAPDKIAVARYRRYLDQAEMRRVLHRVKRERGRKAIRDPKGITYDLTELFESLNFRYFNGLMARPTLGWSLKPSKTTLGHYDPSHHAIVLSCVMDRPEAPRVVVEYVMFHEMLHLRFPTETSGARRCIHTPAFKMAEREFTDYDLARGALRAFVELIREE